MTIKKAVSVLERIKLRLVKAGLTERKATELAKGVAPVAHAVLKSDKPQNLLEKLNSKLQRLGLTERKSKELAKVVAPIARNAVKAQQATSSKPQLPGAAKKDGVVLREDMPTLGKEGGKGADVLQTMMGLTSGRTYVVAAVKSDEGIVAIRRLAQNFFNVKFYPTMAYWGVAPEELKRLGAQEYLQREWYQRMHFEQGGLDKLLFRLESDAKKKSKVRTIIARLKAVTFSVVNKALDRLYGKVAA